MKDYILPELPKQLALLREGQLVTPAKINEIINTINALIVLQKAVVDGINTLPTLEYEEVKNGGDTIKLNDNLYDIGEPVDSKDTTPSPTPDPVVVTAPSPTPVITYDVPNVIVSNGADKFMYDTVIPVGGKGIIQTKFTSAQSTKIALTTNTSRLSKDLWIKDIEVYKNASGYMVVNNMATRSRVEGDGTFKLVFSGDVIRMEVKSTSGEYTLVKELPQSQSELYLKAYKGTDEIFIQTQGL